MGLGVGLGAPATPHPPAPPAAGGGGGGAPAPQIKNLLAVWVRLPLGKAAVRYHRVAQDADSGNLHLNDVARLKGTDA